MIVVTGMHRSGTSLIANLLQKSGLDFGNKSKLISADRWNAKGYYENREIVEINNYLILGGCVPFRYWTVDSDKRSFMMKFSMALSKINYIFLPSRLPISKRARKVKRKISSLSSQYYRIGVKDPRFSLTLGEWRRYGEIDSIVYCYRNPYEVAMSLKKRDKLPLQLGYKVWRYHVEEFFRNAKGTKMIVIDYNNFFSSGREEIKRIRNFCNSGKRSVNLDKIIDRKLKHNTYKNQDLPKNVRETYNMLLERHQEFRKVKTFV